MIDSDYRGEVGILLRNESETHHFRYSPDKALAQLMIVPVPEVELVEVNSLTETKRGSGGFGHTSEAPRNAG